MADLNDFNKPTVADLRLDVHDTNKGHFARAASLNPGTASNRPIGAKLMELISGVFTIKSWTGSVYDTWLTVTDAMRTFLASTTNADARTALSVPSRQEIIAQTFTANATSGTGSAYTISPTPAIAAYAPGQSFWVTFHAECAANATLQINSIATPPNLVVQLPDGTYANVLAKDIPAGHSSRVTMVSTTQALVERVPPRKTLCLVTVRANRNSTANLVVADDTPTNYTVAGPLTYTVNHDPDGTFNVSTGNFTARRAGRYRVTVSNSLAWHSPSTPVTSLRRASISGGLIVGGNLIGPIMTVGNALLSQFTSASADITLAAGATAFVDCIQPTFYNNTGASITYSPYGGAFTTLAQTYNLTIEELG